MLHACMYVCSIVVKRLQTLNEIILLFNGIQFSSYSSIFFFCSFSSHLLVFYYVAVVRVVAVAVTDIPTLFSFFFYFISLKDYFVHEYFQ